jgi:hypothetical protein
LTGGACPHYRLLSMNTAIDGSSAPKPKKGPRRVTTAAHSLDSLVGSHPDALAALYAGAPAADPAELGEAPAGRILALQPLAPVFLLSRPLLDLLRSGAFPWKGKTFDHGGNSGQNRFFGARAVRFRAEVAPSLLDAEPTLVLTYSAKNPWPIAAIRDELRTVADGLAIGPVFFHDRLVAWFGLEGAA